LGFRLLLAVLLLPPLRAAGGETVAVVALAAPAELRFTGKSLADAVARQGARLPELRIVGPEQVESLLGREEASRLAACGASAPCLASLSRRLGVDGVVGGSLDRTGGSYHVSLVHADARTGEALASWDREVPVASRRLGAEVADAAPALLAGRAPPATPAPAR